LLTYVQSGDEVFKSVQLRRHDLTSVVANVVHCECRLPRVDDLDRADGAGTLTTPETPEAPAAPRETQTGSIPV
jgi:hypothetical protein